MEQNLTLLTRVTIYTGNSFFSLFQTVIHELMSCYKFTLEPGQDLVHKWLPVSRPKGNVMVKFEAR